MVSGRVFRPPTALPVPFLFRCRAHAHVQVDAIYLALCPPNAVDIRTGRSRDGAVAGRWKPCTNGRLEWIPRTWPLFHAIGTEQKGVVIAKRFPIAVPQIRIATLRRRDARARRRRLALSKRGTCEKQQDKAKNSQFHADTPCRFCGSGCELPGSPRPRRVHRGSRFCKPASTVGSGFIALIRATKLQKITTYATQTSVL